MKRFVAMGVWGLMFGVVGLFLLTQVIAQPRNSPPTVAPVPTRTSVVTPPARRAVIQPRAKAPKVVKAPTRSTVPAARRSAQPKPRAAVAAKTQTPSQSRDLPPLLVGLYIFLLAIFVGFELISKVPPTLHTPLMSGANAISGITIVGALFCARHSSFSLASVLGFLAVICAMINVVGGFLVTDRMLKMFRN